MAHIEIPAKLDLPTLFHLAKELDQHTFKDELTLHFTEGTFFAPFSMLFLASKLKSLKERNPALAIDCTGYKENGYLAHVGFFRFLGFDHGRDIGEAWGSDSYLPITSLSREQLYEKPDDKWEELPDLIQRHADKIAAIMARDVDKNRDLFDVLSYSVREVMRNVFEHSGANTLYYCAQYWPRSNKVEFAIVDFGMGIRRGLGTNPNFRFATDKQAIEYSLLPSVSGKTHLPRTSNNWFNSGYGLYMTNRLARNGGNFVMASGTTGIHLSRRTKTNYQTTFPGTALRFNMDVDEIGSVADRLSEFRRDGAILAKQISGSGNRPPSAMSLLLRRDYDRRSRF